LVRLTQPCPAQEFCPAQLVVTVAQALVPLQELTLKHLPDTSPADALIGATANMAAAAAASATPVVFLAVIINYSSSLNVSCTGFFLHYASLEKANFQKVQKNYQIFVFFIGLLMGIFDIAE
jgi:hypothetical protein